MPTACSECISRSIGRSDLAVNAFRFVSELHELCGQQAEFETNYTAVATGMLPHAAAGAASAGFANTVALAASQVAQFVATSPSR